MTQQKNFWKDKKPILLGALIGSIIIGCASWRPDPIITTEFVQCTIPTPEEPRGLRLVPPKFEVVNEKKLEEFLADNVKRNGVVIFIAFDVIDYENISRNTAEYDRYIGQQKANLVYYAERSQPKVEKIDD